MPKVRTSYQFAKIFSDEIWRFYIDYYRQLTDAGKQKGAQLFDVDEPGYMAGMLKAHQLLNATLYENLSSKLILQLYRAALEGVSKTNLMEFDRFDRFRSNDLSGFWLKLNTVDKDEGNVSREGLQEFLEEIIANQNENKFEIWSNGKSDVLAEALQRYANNANKKQGLEEALVFLEDKIKTTKCRFASPSMTHKVIEEKINRYILRYESKLQNLSGDEDKLAAIIDLVQKMERLHPFIDGNCRTLVMLVLNRELIRNGFRPTILWNPNRFDFFSHEQLRQEIINGWTYAEKYQSKIANLHSYKEAYNYVDKLYHAASKSLFHKFETETKARNLERLLEDLKTKSPEESIDSIHRSTEQFKRSRGFTTRLVGLDTTTEGLLNNLSKDLQMLSFTDTVSMSMNP